MLHTQDKKFRQLFTQHTMYKYDGLLVHQDFDEPITGLNAFPKEDRPGQVNAVFQFYHIS